MKKFLCVALLLVTGCGNGTDDRRQADYIRVTAEIEDHGYAKVSTLPNGKPLYVKFVSVGYTSDRVYFTEDSIAAVQNCGKNCETSIVSKGL